ncbi:MAG TPA: amidohydrolase family protein [Vicinamibacterales bacterium]|nr:amidohydrolase family protein [Vicinamibacterales bacterium]
MLNDAHCHFFSQRFLETLGREAGDRLPAADARTVADKLGWEPPGTPEELADRWVQELDRYQVGRAVLIASVPGDEESVSAAVRRHPSRFIGFFMVNPLAAGAVDRVRHAVGTLGLRGVCLFPAMHRYSLLDPRVEAVIDGAARPGCAIFIHCGVLSVGARRKLGLPSRFESRHGQPMDVQALAANWPGLPFIIPHFGAGFFREALMAADMCPNIHLDTSSSNGWIAYFPGLRLPDVFRTSRSVVGAERLLFGTDSSFFPRGWQHAIRDAQLAAARDAGFTQSEIELVFGGNLHRLFPLR